VIYRYDEGGIDSGRWDLKPWIVFWGNERCCF